MKLERGELSVEKSSTGELRSWVNMLKTFDKLAADCNAAVAHAIREGRCANLLRVLQRVQNEEFRDLLYGEGRPCAASRVEHTEFSIDNQ